VVVRSRRYGRRIGAAVVACAFVALTSSAAFSLDDQEAESKFQQFQQEWMQKLARNGLYGPGSVQCELQPQDQGLFVATYKTLGQITSVRVKKTQSAGSPYVGILSYEELLYSCRGRTPEEARKGPFQFESRTSVTEIFRFSKGKWLY